MWVVDGIPFLFSYVLYVNCSTRCSSFTFNKISLFKIIERLVKTVYNLWFLSIFFFKSNHSKSNVSISELC